MHLGEYQALALNTWNPPPRDKILDIVYLALGLGETGEVQGKIKKILRDDNQIISDEKREAIAAELGDVLWYVAVLAAELNLQLEDIASGNIVKLASRKQRGVIQGSGDNR